ncbi:hypothetical protein BDV19DRAFT_397905 [Aspergillus venezuelensis]
MAYKVKLTKDDACEEHGYALDGLTTLLPGAFLNNPPHITNAQFQTYCAQFIDFAQDQQWALYSIGANNNQAQTTVPRDTHPIHTGRYLILDPRKKPIRLTLIPSPVTRRVPTHQPPTSHMQLNQRHFRDTVFSRDDRCTITNDRGPDDIPMIGLVAAHIYPLALRDEWVKEGRQAGPQPSSLITDASPYEDIGPNGLVSAQNGIMLTRSIHELWDCFEVGVDPDDDYRTVVFNHDSRSLTGRVLNSSSTSRYKDDNPNHRISDDCLRWHLQQCVLKNLRGIEESYWSLFEDHYEDVNAIMEHDDAAELMEAQLATRLGAYVNVSQPKLATGIQISDPN